MIKSPEELSVRKQTFFKSLLLILFFNLCLRTCLLILEKDGEREGEERQWEKHPSVASHTRPDRIESQPFGLQEGAPTS